MAINTDHGEKRQNLRTDLDFTALILNHHKLCASSDSFSSTGVANCQVSWRLYVSGTSLRLAGIGEDLAYCRKICSCSIRLRKVSTRKNVGNKRS